jgi:hypothetical protein
MSRRKGKSPRRRSRAPHLAAAVDVLADRRPGTRTRSWYPIVVERTDL